MTRSTWLRAWTTHGAAFLAGTLLIIVVSKSVSNASQSRGDSSTAIADMRTREPTTAHRIVRIVDATTGLQVEGARLRWRGRDGEIESDAEEGIARVLGMYETRGWIREGSGDEVLPYALPPTVAVVAEGYATQTFTLPLHPFGSELSTVQPTWTVALGRQGPELRVTVVEAESKNPLIGATVVALTASGSQYVDLRNQPCTANASLDRGGIPTVAVPQAAIVGTGISRTDRDGVARLIGLPKVEGLRILSIDDERQRIGISRSFTTCGAFAMTAIELQLVRGMAVRGTLLPSRPQSEVLTTCVMRGTVDIGDVTAALVFVSLVGRDGVFTFPVVPPGEYDMVVCSNAELLDSYRTRFIIGSKTVTVADRDVSVEVNAMR